MKRHLIYLLTVGVLVIIFMAPFRFFKPSEKTDLTSSSIKRSQDGDTTFIVGEEEGEVIRELIVTMAHTNPAVLAFKKGKLEALGAKLRSKVTTFEFLAFVFSDPCLAKEMKILQESSIKYKRFIEGLSPKMMKEYEKEGFYIRAECFAKHLGIDHAQFLTILNGCLFSAQAGDRGAFKPLIDHLISVKAN